MVNMVYLYIIKSAAMKTTDQVNRLVHKAILITILLLLKLGSASAQNVWKLSTEKEGIKIYTSMVPDSKVKAIKVECDLNVSAPRLVALLMDVNASPDWVYHTKSCVLLKQVSASELYYYSEISLPWPATNRDFVAHLTATGNPHTKVITITGPVVSGFVPVKRGVVRIDHSNGEWIITPTGREQVKVEYTIHTDPGGSLPSWLVNMFATEGPLQMFRNLKKELQKPAYKNNVLAAVEK